MKRYIGIALFVLVVASLLAACGNTTPSSTSSTSAKTTAPGTHAVGTATTGTGTAQANGTSCTAGSTAYTIDKQQSSASYQVQEQFLSRDLPNQAIGTTKNVSGSFMVKLDNAPQILKMNVTANLQQLASDQDRRDNSIRSRWLESDTYPNATFVVTQAQNLPADYQGKTVTFNLTGNLTIHNTTHPETFQVTAKLDGNTISGSAKSLIYMKNYGFSAPDIAGMLTVKDGVTVTFNFAANKSAC